MTPDEASSPCAAAETSVSGRPAPKAKLVNYHDKGKGEPLADDNMKRKLSINALGLDGYEGCEKSLPLRVAPLGSKAMKAKAAMKTITPSTCPKPSAAAATRCPVRAHTTDARAFGNRSIGQDTWLDGQLGKRDVTRNVEEIREPKKRSAT